MSVDMDMLYELVKSEFLFLNVAVVFVIVSDFIISIIKVVMERWKK